MPRRTRPRKRDPLIDKEIPVDTHRDFFIQFRVNSVLLNINVMRLFVMRFIYPLWVVFHNSFVRAAYPCCFDSIRAIKPYANCNISVFLIELLISDCDEIIPWGRNEHGIRLALVPGS